MATGSYCFKTQPLYKPVYRKYKEICKILDINSHQATQLAFETLYDAVQGDYDKVKLRLGQYVNPGVYNTPPQQPTPPPTQSTWPSRAPDFSLPVDESKGLPPFLDDDHRKAFIEGIIGDLTKTYKYRVNADQSTDVWVEP